MRSVTGKILIPEISRVSKKKKQKKHSLSSLKDSLIPYGGPVTDHPCIFKGYCISKINMSIEWTIATCRVYIVSKVIFLASAKYI